ncbi:MAG: carboxypeptidase-like regulatory domain-containing protein [Chlorobi bacterium]|nr:carboxypeptidase-like regulatory domain-containing protein [Chlorobiota bacterium]
MYKFFLSTVGILWHFLIFAQENPVFTGYVFDRQSGLPIENVDVRVLETKYGTTTDNRGFFEFRKLSPGTSTFLFNHIAYFQVEEKIELRPGETKEVEIYLSQNSTDLAEVVVEADNRRTAVISRLPYIQTTIFKQQIEENAVFDWGTATGFQQH